MTQIEELERRITAALDRIAQGVEAFDQAPVPEPAVPEADPAELAALREALSEEQLANAQLEERLRVLRQKPDSPAPDLKAQLAAQSESMTTLDLDLQHLRRANDMLVSTIQELRAALEENVGEPNLINKAMLAELEALRAARAVDAAETRAVLDTLEPLLAEASKHTAEESV
ncbi:hypothetical protein P775_09155 [Puniceibacterium antarcticum]|uniref:Uncharacterized protein n=1 Tax=Puniceibacterium antarcticum TaxID=1206336 RepID=A0A2G8RGH0_9RHOB|nr:hypothetical protein [Puniceibacterium antarcticum]PIL20685.1 hypothetical protein P775_09155 [Puniceibacterium antarcticum]